MEQENLSARKKRKIQDLEEDNLTPEVFDSLFEGVNTIPNEKKKEVYSILKDNFLTNKHALKIIIDAEWNGINIPLLIKQVLKNWVNNNFKNTSKKARTSSSSPSSPSSPLVRKIEPVPVNNSLLWKSQDYLVWIIKNAARNSRVEWRDYTKVKKRKKYNTINDWREKVQIFSTIQPRSFIKSTSNPFPRLVSLPETAQYVNICVEEKTVKLKGNYVDVVNYEADFFNFEICDSSFNKKDNVHEKWKLIFHVFDAMDNIIGMIRTDAFKVYSDFKQHPCTITEIIPNYTFTNVKQTFIVKGDYRVDDSLKLFCHDSQMEFKKIGCGTISFEYISSFPEDLRIQLQYLTGGTKRSEVKTIKVYEPGAEIPPINNTEKTTDDLEEEEEGGQLNQITTTITTSKPTIYDLMEEEDEEIHHNNNTMFIDVVQTPPNDFSSQEQQLDNQNKTNMERNNFSEDEGGYSTTAESTVDNTETTFDKKIENLQNEFQYNLEEVLQWEKTIDKISNAIKNLHKFPTATKDLIQKAQKNITCLKQQKFIVIFAGRQGQGKSEVINKLSAPKEWLIERKIKEDLFGKFPLKSSKGGLSITQFQYRLRYDEQFSYQLIFCDISEFSDRLKTISQDCLYPHLSDDDKQQHIIDNIKQLPKIMKNLNEELRKNPSKNIALTEIILSGPWAFEKDFEIIDTPGFGHDKLQEYLLKKTLNSSPIIATVNSRGAVKEDIKLLINSGAFRKENTEINPTLISFYAAEEKVDDEEDLMIDAEELEGEKGEEKEEKIKSIKEDGIYQNTINTKLLKNTLNSCSFDTTIIIPGIENQNLYIRRLFFARVAKGSMSLSKDHLFDENFRKHIFIQIKKNSMLDLVEQICEQVASCLWVTKISGSKQIPQYNTIKKRWKSAVQQMINKSKINYYFPTIKPHISNYLQDILNGAMTPQQFKSSTQPLMEEMVQNQLEYYKSMKLLLFSEVLKPGNRYLNKKQEQLQLQSDMEDQNENNNLSGNEDIRQFLDSVWNSLFQTQQNSFLDSSSTRIEKLCKSLENSIQSKMKLSSTLDEVFITVCQLIEQFETTTITELNDIRDDIIKDLENEYLEIFKYDWQSLTEDIKHDMEQLKQTVQQWKQRPNKRIEQEQTNANQPFTNNFPVQRFLEQLQDQKQKQIQNSKTMIPNIDKQNHQQIQLSCVEDDSLTLINQEQRKIPIIKISLENEQQQEEEKTIRSTKVIFKLHSQVKKRIIEFREELQKKENRILFPFFMVSWYEPYHNTKLYLQFNNFDGFSHLLFIIVEKSQTIHYINELQNYKPLSSTTILIELPGNNYDPSFGLNIGKAFAEYFSFTQIWFLDHRLSDIREWNALSVNSFRCTLARAAYGMQQFFKLTEEQVLKSVVKMLDDNSTNIFDALKNKSNDSLKIIDILRPRNGQETELNRYTSQELEEFIHQYVKIEKLKNTMLEQLSILNQFSILSSIIGNYHSIEILNNYPDFTRVTHSYRWSETATTGNSRKLEGMLLYNLPALKGFTFCQKNIQWNKEKFGERTLYTFYRALLQNHGSMAVKLTNSKKLLGYQSIWSYQIKTSSQKKRNNKTTKIQSKEEEEEERNTESTPSNNKTTTRKKTTPKNK